MIAAGMFKFLEQQHELQPVDAVYTLGGRQKVCTIIYVANSNDCVLLSLQRYIDKMSFNITVSPQLSAYVDKKVPVLMLHVSTYWTVSSEAAVTICTGEA